MAAAKKAKKPAPDVDKRNFFATMSATVIASIKKAAIDDETTASEILEEAAKEWLARRPANKK